MLNLKLKHKRQIEQPSYKKKSDESATVNIESSANEHPLAFSYQPGKGYPGHAYSPVGGQRRFLRVLPILAKFRPSLAWVRDTSISLVVAQIAGEDSDGKGSLGGSVSKKVW